MKNTLFARVFVGAMLVLSLVLATASCSNSVDTSNFSSVLDKVRSVSQGIDSYRWELGGFTNQTLPPAAMSKSTRAQMSGQGAYSSPDRLWEAQTITRVEQGSPYEDVFGFEIIQIGREVYDREIDQTQWEGKDEPPILKGVYFSPDHPMWLNFESLVEVEQLANENVRGIVCLHYKGKVDMNAYINTLDSPDSNFRQWMENMNTTLEVWIGADDYFIRKYVKNERNPYGMPTSESLSIPPGPEPRMTGVEVMEFYDCNEPIDIEPPL